MPCCCCTSVHASCPHASWPQVVFLGFGPQRIPHFAFALPPDTPAQALGHGADFRWDLKTDSMRAKAPEELGIAAQALAVLDWNARNVHCPLCGAPNKSAEGGHKRVCTAAACLSHKRKQNFCFPRTDATVITVVHDGADRCLLGHAHRHPPGVYSCFAGTHLVRATATPPFLPSLESTA